MSSQLSKQRQSTNIDCVRNVSLLFALKLFFIIILFYI
jgi:hypothetical protein